MMEVLLQLVIEVAVTPLKVTVLEPCEEPKLVPVIVTEEPTAPKVGLRLVIVGVASTVKAEPAVATPLTATTMLPRSRARRDDRCDGSAAPACDRGCRDSVEGYRSTLRRAEVGAGDRDRGTNRARCGIELSNGWRCENREGRTGTGHSADRDDDVA